MKKVLTLITITLFVSCGKNIKDKSNSKKKVENLTELNPDITEPIDDSGSGNDEPSSTDQLDINVKLEGFNETRTIKMNKAIKLLKKVVNGIEFKRRVLEHKYRGETTFVENDNLSNSEIFDKIMKGSEEQLVGENKTIDLIVHLYYSSKNVVGYTYPSKLDIYVNRKYFDPNSLSKVAANLMHEWMHKLGFGHSYYYNSARPYSVPYAIGTMIKDIGPSYE